MRASGAGFCFNVGRGVSAFAPLALGGIAGGYGLPTGLVVCADFFVLSALTMIPLPKDNEATPVGRPALAAPGTTRG